MLYQLLLLQMLASIENYQYSRMRILYMISVYYISKQVKLMKKRKHIQKRRMLRKSCSYWCKKTRTENWWLKMIGEEVSASSWKKYFHLTKESFMKILAKISLLLSPISNSLIDRLLSAEKKLAVTLII